MTKKKTRKQQKANKQQRQRRSRRKSLVVIALILCLGMAGMILAQWRASRVAGKTNAMLVSPAPQISSTPKLSKEYIYAGGKLIATEEPVTTPTPPPPPPPPSSGGCDTIWVEDALPAGATASGSTDGWNWVGTGPAPYSGTLSNQSAVLAGYHDHFFTGATSTLTISTGDKLIAYVYLDPSNTPSEIMLSWNDGNWGYRAYWGANLVTAGTDGTNSRRYMGPLPSAGQWARLEVPADQVGLEGHTLTGLSLIEYNGRATWDHVGKACMTPPPPSTDTVWMEDAVPTGATAYGDNDGWSWASSSPVPISGTQANQSSIVAGFHDHFFLDATPGLAVNAGDALIAYVYLDPANTPTEIMLSWNDGNWGYRAYWGANVIGAGTDGTASRRYMGPLPIAGRWVRLEVPASQVGLVGHVVTGLSFIEYDGRAMWDHVGKSGPPAPPPTDTVWMEDAVPTGAAAYGDNDGWSWASSNPTPISGQQANQSSTISGFHDHFFLDATPGLAINTGDKLIAYVYLDPANPPTEIMLSWNDGNWGYRAYWGANVIGAGTDGTASRRYMGALPQTGQWVRLEVPASQVGLEGHVITGLSFIEYDGRAAWDHVGKSAQ